MKEEVERYLAHLRTDRGASENTIAAYRRDLAQAREAAGDGGEPPSAAQFMKYLEGRFAYSRSSMNRKISVLMSFLDFLGIESERPRELEPVPGHEPAAHASDRDLQGMMRALSENDTPPGIRDAAILQLLRDTGMKAGELAGLDLGDIRDGRIALPGRKLAITASSWERLEPYLGWARGELLGDRSDSGAVFISHRGARLSRQWIFRAVRDAAIRSGADGNITPESIRHSFALRMLEQGMSPGQLGAAMGHRSPQTVHRYRRMMARPGGNAGNQEGGEQ